MGSTVTDSHAAPALWKIGRCAPAVDIARYVGISKSWTGMDPGVGALPHLHVVLPDAVVKKIPVWELMYG
jgi:hypothetical protein